MICGVLMFFVNVNADLSKYLPNDSPMKHGLVILQDELAMNADMAGASIRIMTENQSESDKVDMRYQLLQWPEIENVILQENGAHTLYEVSVNTDVNQVELKKKIHKQYPVIDTIETSQDGATADGPMLIGAVALLLLVLAAMCSSWLEPILFLASTGIAVLLNMGTNALLPSVSVTTHSIASILQLVLSMDYSIILINRFRQEREHTEVSTVAMQHAINKAAPAILSSALTTIVGLLMLIFMKLRIGADLGIVLSKGVLFSLFCNFAVLPSLILIFENGIKRTEKKVIRFHTERLAQFSMKYRIPLAIFFLLLLGSSYWLHNQTPISFLNAQESKINQYFPKKNPVVIIYNNQDESQVVELMDSLMTFPGVEMALSYPSLMMKEYKVPQMLSAIQEMTNLAPSDGLTDALPLDMLSDDILRLVYYASHGKPIEKIGFNTLINFILEQSQNPTSFIASQMNTDMKQKMAMYKDFQQMNTLIEEDLIIDTLLEENINQSTLSEDIPDTLSKTIEFPELPIATIVENHSPFADTALINQPRSSTEMASYLGMDATQAKMVFRLAKRASQKMSAIEFVRFLTDDILKRKALASMISSEQRQQLIALRATMDSTLTTQQYLETSIQEPTLVVAPTETHPKPIVIAATPIDTLTSIDTLVVADDPLTLLDELMTSNKCYTPTEMARNFSAMGEPINCGLIQMLYLYYGGQQHFDSTWTMSLQDMINYLTDTLINDTRFSLFITDDIKSSILQAKSMINQRLGMMRSPYHSVAVLVTNLKTESEQTHTFIQQLHELCHQHLNHPYYTIGESEMIFEMRQGFHHEMRLVTLLTIIAIFIIVMLSFKSLLIALLLVATVMTGVFVDVAVSAINGGSILYMAYLVVQSILMGAAIDYGILFANYYREKRAKLNIVDSLQQAYKGSIHTILTSGLILILVPGIMAILVSDATVASIVRAISVGALATVLLVIFVLPGLLATFDKLILPPQKSKE